MKKIKTILLLILMFGILTLACSFNQNDEDSVKDPEKLEEGEKTEITGRVSYYYDGDYFFTLVDADQEYTIFISGDENIQTGDYVKAQGPWLKESNALDTEKLTKLSEEEKMKYLNTRYPMFEITVLDYPKSVGHTCETPKFSLRLKNTGIETITHEDLHSYHYNYAFYYFINENWSKANGDREDYAEVAEQDNLRLVGVLSNQGFLYFEDIEPGQSGEVEYWAGGQISKNEFGTAGSPNIFGNYSVGEHDFSFAWAEKNNYDPIFFYQTAPVKINLASTRCVM